MSRVAKISLIWMPSHRLILPYLSRHSPLSSVGCWQVTRTSPLQVSKWVMRRSKHGSLLNGSASEQLLLVHNDQVATVHRTTNRTIVSSSRYLTLRARWSSVIRINHLLPGCNVRGARLAKKVALIRALLGRINTKGGRAQYLGTWSLLLLTLTVIHSSIQA